MICFVVFLNQSCWYHCSLYVTCSDIVVDVWDCESRLCWANKHHQAMLSCYPGNGAQVLYAHGGKLDKGAASSRPMNGSSKFNKHAADTHVQVFFFQWWKAAEIRNHLAIISNMWHVALLIHALHPKKEKSQVVCRCLPFTSENFYQGERRDVGKREPLDLTYPHSETQNGSLRIHPSHRFQVLGHLAVNNGLRAAPPKWQLCSPCRGG